MKGATRYTQNAQAALYRFYRLRHKTHKKQQEATSPLARCGPLPSPPLPLLLLLSALGTTSQLKFLGGHI
jgi:hypothetical protein